MSPILQKIPLRRGVETAFRLFVVYVVCATAFFAIHVMCDEVFGRGTGVWVVFPWGTLFGIVFYRWVYRKRDGDLSSSGMMRKAKSDFSQSRSPARRRFWHGFRLMLAFLIAAPGCFAIHHVVNRWWGEAGALVVAGGWLLILATLLHRWIKSGTWNVRKQAGPI